MGKLGERRGGEEGSRARVPERTRFQFRGLLPFPSRRGLPGLLCPGPRLGSICRGLGFELGAGRTLPPPAHAPPHGVCACAGSTRAGLSPGDSQKPPNPESGAPESVHCITVSSRRRDSSPRPQSGSDARLRGLLCRTWRSVEISLLQLRYRGREEATWFLPLHFHLKLSHFRP